jgi:hypothetical protein
MKPPCCCLPFFLKDALIRELLLQKMLLPSHKFVQEDAEGSSRGLFQCNSPSRNSAVTSDDLAEIRVRYLLNTNRTYWTNCAFGLYPSSCVSRTNKIDELKIIIDKITVHTSTNKSHKGQLLTTEKFTRAHTHINPWSRQTQVATSDKCTLHST